MPQFPLKEGVSVPVGGYSRGMREGSSWERVWIREPKDGGVSSASSPGVPLKFLLNNSGAFELG